MSAMPTAPPLVDEAAPAPSMSSREAFERIQAKLVRPLPNDRLLGWLLPIAITVLAGVARFWRITRPGGVSMTNKNDLVFDETYYAHDSWTLLHHGVELNGPQTKAGFVVHPPLGKWMMAVGEAIFDHGKTVTFGHGSSATVYPASPMSFRFMGALLGTLAILIVARIARRMFRSTALGVIAGALFALDGLEFVQSRTAMLDIYLMFWIVAAFACLVADRDDGRRRLAQRLTGPLHPNRMGAVTGRAAMALGHRSVSRCCLRHEVGRRLLHPRVPDPRDRLGPRRATHGRIAQRSMARRVSLRRACSRGLLGRPCGRLRRVVDRMVPVERPVRVQPRRPELRASRPVLAGPRLGRVPQLVELSAANLGL